MAQKNRGFVGFVAFSPRSKCRSRASSPEGLRGAWGGIPLQSAGTLLEINANPHILEVVGELPAVGLESGEFAERLPDWLGECGIVERRQKENSGPHLPYSAGSCFRSGGMAGATQAGLGFSGSVALHAVTAVVMRPTMSGCCWLTSFDSLRSVARS